MHVRSVVIVYSHMHVDLHVKWSSDYCLAVFGRSHKKSHFINVPSHEPNDHLERSEFLAVVQWRLVSKPALVSGGTREWLRA